MPARRRARRFTPSGSRRGSTATFRTTLLGTMIESSPVAKVVYSSPSELTVPSNVPASGPPCRRTRSPTRNGRALSRTVPANRFPSVCCAASPRITAVKAPPRASVRASMPATRSATTTATSTVTRRTRNPTVPAVAGSSRRNSGGPSTRPSARAIAQPRITRATTTIAVTVVSSTGSRTLRAGWPWWAGSVVPSRLTRLS